VVEIFYFRDSQRRGFLVIEDLESVTPEAFRGAGTGTGV
jgi:hypothetical protein